MTLTYEELLNRIPFGLLALLLLLEAWSARHRRSEASPQDRGSYWVLHFGIVVAYVLAFTLCRWRPFGWPTRLGHWAPFAGSVVAIAGWGLRAWAVATLGPLFTRDVRVTERQPVIRTGPFRWMRHPSYTGLLLESIGIGLAVRSSLSLVLITSITAATVVYRVFVEERALVDSLGNDYRDYARTTRRFLPFIG